MSADLSKNSAMRRSSGRGIALLELMIALLIFTLLLLPIYHVLSVSSTTAFKGMVRSDITLEARRLLRQVHDDLKYSVFFVDYNAPITDTIQDCFDRMLNPSFGEAYSLLRFPLQGKVEDFIETSSGGVFRIPVRVSYRLVKIDNLLFALYRQEGNNTPRCLSKRINFFDIQSHPIAPSHTAWLVNLQLADISKAVPSDTNLKELESVANLAYNDQQRRLMARTHSVIIADFFNAVASEYYNCFRRSKFIPNWQTLLIQR